LVNKADWRELAYGKRMGLVWIPYRRGAWFGGLTERALGGR